MRDEDAGRSGPPVSPEAATGLLRALLTPLQSNQLLLPGSAVMEVLPLGDIRAQSGAPAWLLGQTGWRGETLPLLHFEALFGAEPIEPARRQRMVVLNALGVVEDLPHYALWASSAPRMLTLTRAALSTQPGQPKAGVLSRALLAGKPVLIPDLAYVERAVHDFMEAQSGRSS